MGAVCGKGGVHVFDAIAHRGTCGSAGGDGDVYVFVCVCVGGK